MRRFSVPFPFMKKLIVLLLAAAAIAGGGYAFKDKLFGPHKEVLDPNALTAVAEKRDLDFSVEISGDVTPATTLDVKSEVGGKLKALHVVAGQSVKEGEVLVEID